MTFAPVVPTGGFTGLQHIDRTRDAQTERFATSPEIARRLDAFRARAPGITSIDALLSDREVLRVALDAFGLGDQVDKTGFLRRILEDGVASDDALAMRLSDRRWRDFADTFTFDGSAGRFRIDESRREIAEAYRNRALASLETAADSQLRSERIAELVSGGTAAEDITEADLIIQADIRLTRLDTLRAEIDADVSFVIQAGGAAATLDVFLSDETFRRVATGAFGLAAFADDTEKLREYLEGGHTNPVAPSRLDRDPAWARFVEAMDFAGARGPLVDPLRVEEIAGRALARNFDAALGQTNPEIEAALSFRREIGRIATGAAVDRAGWFQVMGQPELRQVIETLYNLPASFAGLDIDRQASVLTERTEQRFGASSPAIFADPEVVDETLRVFLALESGQQSASATAAGTALAVLSAGRLGTDMTANLFTSNL